MTMHLFHSRLDSLWRMVATFMAFVVSTPLAAAQELPHVERRGQATQLIVDGAPYLALGGELHNSSPSSPAYMAPVWDRLQRNNVKTVIGVASWV